MAGGGVWGYVEEGEVGKCDGSGGGCTPNQLLEVIFHYSSFVRVSRTHYSSVTIVNLLDLSLGPD